MCEREDTMKINLRSLPSEASYCDTFSSGSSDCMEHRGASIGLGSRVTRQASQHAMACIWPAFARKCLKL